jgi:hypothetical protein
MLRDIQRALEESTHDYHHTEKGNADLFHH